VNFFASLYGIANTYLPFSRDYRKPEISAENPVIFIYKKIHVSPFFQDFFLKSHVCFSVISEDFSVLFLHRQLCDSAVMPMLKKSGFTGRRLYYIPEEIICWQ